MIEIFESCKGGRKQYSIWDQEGLLELETLRLAWPPYSLELPFDLMIEQVQLLVIDLKKASIFKTIAMEEEEEEEEDLVKAFIDELQREETSWKLEWENYKVKMKDIYTSSSSSSSSSSSDAVAAASINERKSLLIKPELPILIERNSKRHPWIKKVEVLDFNLPSSSSCKEVEVERYLIFKTLWEQRWWIGNGFKFGGDYLLYQEHPTLCHSSYILLISKDAGGRMRAKDIVNISRLGTNVKKKVLLCSVSSADDDDDDGKLDTTGINGGGKGKRLQLNFVSTKWTGWV